jgi:hypothetical protein
MNVLDCDKYCKHYRTHKYWVNKHWSVTRNYCDINVDHKTTLTYWRSCPVECDYYKKRSLWDIIKRFFENW